MLTRLLGWVLVVSNCVVVMAVLGMWDVHPAAADPISRCSSSKGVIIVVDFAPWGGKVERGCDPAPTTGYDALHVAGFTTSGDDQDGPAFICRIDDLPPPSQQTCLSTPPASAYWSYWHADAGQRRWSYSELGAMSYKPPPGSIDAWVFASTDVDGAGGYPPFSPTEIRAEGVGPATSPRSNTGGTRASRPVGATESSSSSGFVVGAAVVIVLGGVAAMTAWRRRRWVGGG